MATRNTWKERDRDSLRSRALADPVGLLRELRGIFEKLAGAGPQGTGVGESESARAFIDAANKLYDAEYEFTRRGIVEVEDF